MNDAERAEGVRLLAGIPTDPKHGAWSYTPWHTPEDAPIGTVRGADGMQVASVWPGRRLAMWDGNEARAVVWLVNHAAELLADSAALAERDAEIARLRAELEWARTAAG